jgi:hypothetical protein
MGCTPVNHQQSAVQKRVKELRQSAYIERLELKIVALDAGQNASRREM